MSLESDLFKSTELAKSRLEQHAAKFNPLERIDSALDNPNELDDLLRVHPDTETLEKNEAVRFIEDSFDRYITNNVMNHLYGLKDDAKNPFLEADFKKAKDNVFDYKLKLINSLPQKVKKQTVKGAIFDVLSFLSEKPSVRQLSGYVKNDAIPNSLQQAAVEKEGVITKKDLEQKSEKQKSQEQYSEQVQLPGETKSQKQSQLSEKNQLAEKKPESEQQPTQDSAKKPQTPLKKPEKTEPENNYRDYLGPAGGSRNLFLWAENNLQKNYKKPSEMIRAFNKTFAEVYKGLKKDNYLLERAAVFFNRKVNQYHDLIKSGRHLHKQINEISRNQIITDIKDSFGLSKIDDLSLPEKEIRNHFKENITDVLKRNSRVGLKESTYLTNVEIDILNNLMHNYLHFGEPSFSKTRKKIKAQKKAGQSNFYAETNRKIEDIIKKLGKYEHSVRPLEDAIKKADSKKLSSQDKKENIDFYLKLMILKERAYMQRSKIYFNLEKIDSIKNELDLIVQSQEFKNKKYSSLKNKIFDSKLLIADIKVSKDSLMEHIKDKIYPKSGEPMHNLLNIGVTVEDFLPAIEQHYSNKKMSIFTLDSIAMLIHCSEIIRKQIKNSYGRFLSNSPAIPAYIKEKYRPLSFEEIKSLIQKKIELRPLYSAGTKTKTGVNLAKKFNEHDQIQEADSSEKQELGSNVISMEQYLKENNVHARKRAEFQYNSHRIEIQQHQKAKEYAYAVKTGNLGKYNNEINLINSSKSYTDAIWNRIHSRASVLFKNESELDIEARTQNAYNKFIADVCNKKQNNMLLRRYSAGLNPRLVDQINKSKDLNEALFKIDCYWTPVKNIDKAISFWKIGVLFAKRRLNFGSVKRKRTSDLKENIIDYTQKVDLLYRKKSVKQDLTINEQIDYYENAKINFEVKASMTLRNLKGYSEANISQITKKDIEKLKLISTSAGRGFLRDDYEMFVSHINDLKRVKGIIDSLKQEQKKMQAKYYAANAQHPHKTHYSAGFAA